MSEFSVSNDPGTNRAKLVRKYQEEYEKISLTLFSIPDIVPIRHVAFGSAHVMDALYKENLELLQKLRKTGTVEFVRYYGDSEDLAVIYKYRPLLSEHDFELIFHNTDGENALQKYSKGGCYFHKSTVTTEEVVCNF